YRDVYNRATIMAAKDQKLEWIYGDTVKHCVSCSSLSGKVKRGSQWEAFFEKTGLRPQSPRLACKGFECKCDTVPTTKPMSMGRLPIKY
ncbi:MAG TPA: hypothetical protein VMW34_12170, partial [Anaerolineales bacterium]|nr:hypothetical protein [Anaerolineales bacterium]